MCLGGSVSVIPPLKSFPLFSIKEYLVGVYQINEHQQETTPGICIIQLLAEGHTAGIFEKLVAGFVLLICF